MKILKTLFWISLFAVATFLWIVVFEHGFGGFSSGAKAELQSLRQLFGGG